jgi:hypothetical protein
MSNLNNQLFILLIDGECLSLQSVSPGNSNEIAELKELNNKGLTKLLVIDTSYSYIFHQRYIQKLITNLSTKNNSITELIGKTQGNHSVLQVGASNIWFRSLAPAEEALETEENREINLKIINKDKRQQFNSLLSYFRKQCAALL